MAKFSIRNNLYFKLIVIFILMLLLLIPTQWVREMIRERSDRSNSAKSEVSEKWGSAQTITGPILSIPYEKIEIRDKRKVVYKGWLHLLPDKLEVDGEITPQIRKRGIYEVVLYGSELNISGSFSLNSIADIDVQMSDLQYDKAIIELGLTDLKGVTEQISIRFNNQDVPYDAGLISSVSTSAGMHCNVKLDSQNKDDLPFSMRMSLNGSSNMFFSPVGKETHVTLSSNWTSPSFTGQFLPQTHEVTADGFNADWKILNLNRNFPQYWFNQDHEIGSSFGVGLIMPVDHYQKTDRVAKYAILFLVFTFLTFFFVEILQKIFIHSFQYLLIGLAITIFYVLILSFSEHIGFDLAYLTASVMTIGLISYYSSYALRSKYLTLMLSSILIITYGFIYVTIGLEDYALLFGSIGLFLVLAVVMTITRKVKWNELELNSEKGVE